MDQKQKKALETMRRFIENHAAAGFESEEAIVSGSLEYMDGEADPKFLHRYAKKFARDAFARLRPRTIDLARRDRS